MSNCDCEHTPVINSIITNARRRSSGKRRVRSYDPTATTTLREAFAREVRVRFKALARDVKEAVLQLDVLGLATNEGTSEGAKRGWDKRGRGPSVGVMPAKGSEGSFRRAFSYDGKYAGGTSYRVEGDTLHVDQLFVEQDMQRKGIASTALSLIAEEHGAKKIVPHDETIQGKAFFSAFSAQRRLMRNELIANAVQLPQRAFAFGRSSERVEAFRDWLNQKVREKVFSVTTGPGNRSAAMGVPWSRVYVDSAYKRGIARADAAIRKAGASNPLAATWTPAPIAARFLGPIHVDRIGLIHSRVYSELKGITDSMERSIADTLARGIGEGRSPRELASALENRITGEGDELGIWDTQGRWIPAERRAELLARTEIINAHTKASVATYREAGIMDVEVLAEWQATPDGRVCPKCEEMNGKIFTLDEIERLIPLHPLCRCAAIPAGVGEEVNGRTRRADLGTGFKRKDMTEDAQEQIL